MAKMPSTQEHLDLVDIIGCYVIHKQGVSAVLQPSPVNFDLLSEREQDAMINVFAGLLNSLNNPLQVVIRTKRTDLSNYIKQLETQESRQMNRFLKDQITSYREYVIRLSSRQDVLDKKFYVVVTYFDPSIGSSKGFLSSKPRINPQEIMKHAKAQIDPKIDQVQDQLTRLGVKVRILGEEELVQLYYNIYNPTTAQQEHLTVGVDEYTSAMIEPIPESFK